MLSFIEISKANLLSNIRGFKKLLPKNTEIVAVVKGNAYGHGQNEIADIVKDRVDYFQVDDINELRLLRKITNKATFVFGYVSKEELEELVKLNGIPGMYDINRALVLDKLARKYNKKIKIHIKIDALLGRQGLLLEDIPEFARKLIKLKHLAIDGIYSHFSNIEDTNNLSHALKQLEYFNKAVKLFADCGITCPHKHFSATSGILVNKLLKERFDIARLGIGMYGLWPSDNLKKRYRRRIKLKPVLKWITHIAQVKTVGKGFPIGYGLTYITKKPTTIAVIPQGYSDGYGRGLSNSGFVEINKHLCTVVGRVAMNMFVVDVTNIKVKQGDEVSLIGDKVTAEDIATKLKTINYEVVTRISPLLPRKIN